MPRAIVNPVRRSSLTPTIDYTCLRSHSWTVSEHLHPAVCHGMTPLLSRIGSRKPRSEFSSEPWCRPGKEPMRQGIDQTYNNTRINDSDARCADGGACQRSCTGPRAFGESARETRRATHGRRLPTARQSWCEREEAAELLTLWQNMQCVRYCRSIVNSTTTQISFTKSLSGVVAGREL